MQMFKLDLMTLLVVIVIVGVMLTMGMGHLNASGVNNAGQHNQVNMSVEQLPGSSAARFMNTSGNSKSPATVLRTSARI